MRAKKRDPERGSGGVGSGMIPELGVVVDYAVGLVGLVLGVAFYRFMDPLLP